MSLGLGVRQRLVRCLAALAHGGVIAGLGWWSGGCKAQTIEPTLEYDARPHTLQGPLLTDVLQAAGVKTGEALQLLLAPNTPQGPRDLLLMPDQMMLQIHESIGHPLELDRILGDERNFAGTSFVTPDMFGSYRYGSDLLNVWHDPHQAHEFAGFAFDDDGLEARRGARVRRLSRGDRRPDGQALRGDGV